MRIPFVVILATSLGLPVMGAVARPPNALPPPVPGQAPAYVIGVEGAGAGGTDLRAVTDLANVLNGPDLRIVPIIGQGSVQNLDDLLHLRGVDVAVVQADVLAGAEREQLLKPGMDRSIQYIAKLFDEEVHVIAGPDVRMLDDLRGKTINADLPRSGSALTARLLFRTLGIPVTFTPDPQNVAIEKLKRERSPPSCGSRASRPTSSSTCRPTPACTSSRCRGTMLSCCRTMRRAASRMRTTRTSSRMSRRWTP